MQLAYFYDMPLPTRYAAAIQILHTCHQLAVQDVPLTVYVRSLTGTEAEALARYGLQPHPLLRIRPLHGTLPYRLLPRRTLTGLLQNGHSPDEPRIVISRGESGVELYPQLRAAIQSTPHVHWIYEAHRLCASGSDSVELTEGHLHLDVQKVRKLEEAAVCHAEGLVCLTPAVEMALRELYAFDAPVLVLPSGVSVPGHEPGPDGQRDIDVLYAGKLERRKGILDLLGAMQHLPQYRATVAGGSPAEVTRVRTDAQALGVESRVDFLGFIDPVRTDALYARARVGVCPLPSGESMVSEQFTSPLKLLNLMAWRVPVVATAVPSVERIVRHEDSALLVPPGDTAAMAAAIGRLLEDRRLAARLSARAREIACHYSWQHRARRLKDFLLDLCESK